MDDLILALIEESRSGDMKTAANADRLLIIIQFIKDQLAALQPK